MRKLVRQLLSGILLAMETLLLGLAQLVLGLSSGQTAETPSTLLQPHGSAAPNFQTAATLPVKQAKTAGKSGLQSTAGALQVSDSNRSIRNAKARQQVASNDISDEVLDAEIPEREPSKNSIQLRRGPQGEAFVTSAEEDNANYFQISQVPPRKVETTGISDQPIMPSSTTGPALRPSLSPPPSITPSSGDAGSSVYRQDPPSLQRLEPPKDDAPVQRDPNSKIKLHAHGDEFPTDINDISPSTQTDDQVPEKPGTVSGSISYDEQKQENPTGGAVLSIFQALDQALVKSPRASALRSLLPVTQSEMARATEQPGPDWTYDNGVAAEQTRRTGVVFNWEPPWKLIFRLLAARRLVEQTKQDLLSQLWSLRAEVRLAYTEVVVAQETLETLNSLYDLAHRLMVVSEKRFQAGDVPELDMLKARLAESQYDVERRVGLRRVIRAKQQLNVIMGRKPETPLTIPRLPPFLSTEDIARAANAKNILLPDFSARIATLEYYLDMAVKHRYELKALERQIAVNKAQLRNAYGNIIPSPQFWIGSSQAGNPPSGPRLGAYYFGVNVPSNITDFQQGDIAKFKAVARQLKYQTGALNNVITSEVSSAYNNVLAARQKLRIYQEHVLADSYEVARLARRSYEVGQSDITSTIQAQQNNVQIRTQYLEAIQLYQQAFTELERACGTPLLEAEE